MQCSICGATSPDGARFRQACGRNLFDGSLPPPVPTQTAAPPRDSRAVVSLVLGTITLLTWCLPIIGLPLAIIGLVLGIHARKSAQRGLAIAGIMLCSIGLAVALANAAAGAYLAVTGQHPLVNWLGQ